MRFLDIYVVILVLFSMTKTVTTQFINLPSNITVPENTQGGSYVFKVILSAPANPLDYLIEYDPSSAADLFSHAFVPDGKHDYANTYPGVTLTYALCNPEICHSKIEGSVCATLWMKQEDLFDPLMYNERISRSRNGVDVSVRVGAILDYETLPNQYRINVIDLAATGGSGEGELPPPPLAKKRQTEPGSFVIGVLTINLTDVNEPPTFNDATYSVSVLESKIPLDPFVRLPSPAFDADVNDTISYEIDSIFPNINVNILAMNSTTGNIKLIGEYDVDNNVQPDVLIITVKAVDESGLSNTLMLYVNILDVNDNDPVFTGTGNYVILLPYDYAGISGTEIGYVHADDDDGTDIVSYNLDTKNRYFSVDINTGYIQLTSPLPVDTISSGVYQFNIRATSFSINSEGSAGSATASVRVYVVPFCTDEAEKGCNLCNESSSDMTYTTSETTLPPRVTEGSSVSRSKRAEGDSTVNTCPKTLCSRCHDYLTETCLSGTVPLSTLGNSPGCSTSQTGDVSSANIRICWILPLVITVAVAAVIIGCCLYKRQLKIKNSRVVDISNSKNTTKPDVITTIEPTTELGNFRKPVVIQG